jgi:HEPN domain-containing protein
VLTRYAVNTRYPGLEEDVTEAEHGSAVELATRVVEWAAKIIEEKATPEKSE